MARASEGAPGARSSLVLLVALLGAAAVHFAGAVSVEPTAAAPSIRSKQAGRQLLVNTDPSPHAKPKTTPFDNSLQTFGPDVSHLDPRVAMRGEGCDAPNQVHLTLWTSTSVLVSWVTCDYRTGAKVTHARETPGHTSLKYWRTPKECDGYDPAYTEEALDEDDEDEQAQPASGVEADTAKYGKKKHSKKTRYHYKEDEEERMYNRQHSKKHEDEDEHEDKKHSKKHEGEDKHEHKKSYHRSEEEEKEYYGEHHCGKPILAKGVTTSYYYNYSPAPWSSPASNYASGIIHHVLIKDLEPGATYLYRVCGEESCEIFEFTVPALKFPLRMGMMADPGMTLNTTVMLDRMIREAPDLVGLIGDFCYADHWKTWDVALSNADFALYPNGLTWQPKWDVWSQLFEPLLAHVPLLHANGNHEIEGDLTDGKPNGIRMRSYNHRFPVPQTEERRKYGPKSFPPASLENKWENLYYTVELPGIFKAIHLTSYSFGQPMNAQEEQYKWLQAELAKTDREKTPWLMVNWHSPWYNTYATHFKENEAMRQAYEKILLEYKVDIVFNGHVHAYERKAPIANNQVSRCGPVSITIGDGGNVEGTYRDFIDTIYKTKNYCNASDPKFGQTWNSYQPQQFTMLETRQEWCNAAAPFGLDCFCYTKQVDWSAYREPSFGYGMLTFESATEATWTWHKNQADAFQIGDQVKIMRGGYNSPDCHHIDCECITTA